MINPLCDAMQSIFKICIFAEFVSLCKEMGEKKPSYKNRAVS